MADDQIVCMDCGQTFTFTEEEKAFYAQKGFVQPKRCLECRKKKKGSSKRPGGGPKQNYDVTCCDCGCATQVPFKPKEGLPVYCKECFMKRKGSGRSGKPMKSSTDKAKDIPTIPESKDNDDTERSEDDSAEIDSFDEDSDDFGDEDAGED